jgi:sugar diacid utilization regulator
MKPELQVLVESMGAQLSRSVAIDDSKLNLLAYSPHTGEVDEARVLSIMHRRVAEHRVEHALGRGARSARDIFIVPVRPELGLTIERIAMPIRHDDALLGFMWLMASEGEVTEETRQSLREGAAAAGLILRKELMSRESERAEERELVRELLADDDAGRASAARRLEEQGFLAAGPVVVLTINLALENDDFPLERDAVALASAIEHTSRRFPSRKVVRLRRPDHAVLVISRSALPHHDVAAVGKEARDRIAAESGRPPSDWWIGLGEERSRIEESIGSYHESRRAAVVARVSGSTEPVAKFSHVGVFGVLSQLPASQLQESLHPGLVGLMEAGEAGDALLQTLATYLDQAGDVKSTAELLSVHRTTLYYRLGRIEELASVDLNNGDDRLTLHLGLRIIKLLGMRGPRAAGPR